MIRRYITSLICFILIFTSVYGIEVQDSNIVLADSAYARADYEKAIELYSSVLNKGNNIASAEIFYNLGCSYYKNGDIPYAILNFERALRLKPGDDDVKFNLKLAKGQTLDKMEDNGTFWLKRVFDNFAMSTKLTTWMWLGIVTFVLVCAGLLFFFFYTGAVNKRKVAFYSAIVALCFCILFNLLAGRNYVRVYDKTEAIITAQSVTLKSSPDASSENLAILHGGIKIIQLQELNQYVQVLLPNGAQGWLSREDITQILPSEGF